MFHSIQTAPQPGCVVSSVPKFQVFSVFSFPRGGILCLGQIKVAELCSQILGQNNPGPRPRDTQGCIPTAQLNCHLLAAALLACGGQGPGCDVQKAGCPCGADFSLIFSCWSILNKPFPSVTLL